MAAEIHIDGNKFNWVWTGSNTVLTGAKFYEQPIYGSEYFTTTSSNSSTIKFNLLDDKTFKLLYGIETKWVPGENCVF